MKARRDNPEQRLAYGILMIIASLMVGYVFIVFALRGVFSGFLLALALFSYGIYSIKTLPTYKRRYFTPRTFSTPVSPDDSALEDNSLELQKQIDEEICTISPRELKTKSIFFASLIIGFITTSALDRYCLVALFPIIYSFGEFIKYTRGISLKAERILIKSIIVAGLAGICLTLVLNILMLEFQTALISRIIISSLIIIFSIAAMIYGFKELKKLKSQENTKINEPKSEEQKNL